MKMFKRSFFLALVLLYCLGSFVHGKLPKSIDNAKTVSLKRAQSLQQRAPAQQFLFSCNFDTSDCEIEIDEDDIIDGTPVFQIISTLEADSGYKFTDVSSITQPAANGQYCNIPFSVGGIEYFHCTGNLQCQTSSGLSSCQSGSFLGGGFREPEQRNTISFPVRSGFYGDILYELTFEAFMYCEGDDQCTDSNDIIQVDVFSYGTDSLFKVTKVVKFNDFAQAKAWQKFSLPLTGLDNVFYVEVVVVKDFYPKVNSTTYYGIDEIQVKFVERYDEVYKCDFDSANCFDLDNGTNVFWLDNIVESSNVFTDFSSTNKLTDNGRNCKIPFYDNDQILRYHCTADNECSTSAGFANCAPGRFLGGYTNNSVSSFFFEKGMTTMTLPLAPAKYRYSFNAFMYCDGDEATCQQTSNFLHFYAFNESFLAVDLLLRLKNFDGRTSWTKFEGFFESTKLTLLANFVAGRYGSSDAITFFGFDELQLSLVTTNLEPMTTRTSTTPSRPTSTGSSVSTQYMGTSPTSSSSTTTTSTTSSVSTSSTPGSTTGTNSSTRSFSFYIRGTLIQLILVIFCLI